MNNVDAAVLITKKVTGDFRREALRFKDKLIVHATCTGYGSTRIEPNVYPYFMQLNNTKLLVLDGFPINQVYIRVDPIIPTDEGIAVANNVITMAENLGFYKFRVSVIDMYKHVVNRFNRAGIEMPFSGFQATNEQFDNVSKMLLRHYKSSFEACAETKLRGIQNVGCISKSILDILGIDSSSIKENNKGQRNDCLCLDCKTELLSNKHRCSNGCLYCYWRD